MNTKTKQYNLPAFEKQVTACTFTTADFNDLDRLKLFYEYAMNAIHVIKEFNHSLAVCNAFIHLQQQIVAQYDLFASSEVYASLSDESDSLKYRVNINKTAFSIPYLEGKVKEWTSEYTKLDMKRQIAACKSSVRLVQSRIAMSFAIGDKAQDPTVKQQQMNLATFNKEKPVEEKQCDENPSVGEAALQTIGTTSQLEAYYDENILAPVRVYVRLNSQPGLQHNPEPNAIKRGDCVEFRDQQHGATYGPFVSVFPEGSTNQQLMDGTYFASPVQPMNTFFRQTLDGYSNILFGYGYSGSGKSYSLFGDDKTRGIADLAIEDLKAHGATVSLYSLFELHGTLTAMASTNVNESDTVHIDLNLIVHYGFDAEFQRGPALYPSLFREKFGWGLSSKQRQEQEINASQSGIQWGQSGIEWLGIDLDSPHRLITKIRKVSSSKDPITSNIRPTPNNPHSSRSHLVYGVCRAKRW